MQRNKKNFSFPQPRKFFLDHLPHYQNEDIVSIEQNKLGYTNQSFHFVTQDKKEFYVRWSNKNNLHQWISRDNEWLIFQILKISQINYYDLKTGDCIKEWIIGRHPYKKEYFQDWFLKQLFQEIDHIQQISTHPLIKKNIHPLKIDFYLQFCDPKNQLYLDYFLKFFQEYAQEQKLYFAHGDLSPHNIIVTPQNQIKVIDYEWTFFAHKNWDLANFLREAGARKKQLQKLVKYGYDIQELFKQCFLATFYAYLWAEMWIKHNQNIAYRLEKYKDQQIKLAIYYFKLIDKSSY